MSTLTHCRPSSTPPDNLHSLSTKEAAELIEYYRPPPPPSLIEWAYEYRAIDGIPFTLDRYPCLVELYQDESDFIIVMKPNQVGASEWLLNVSLHALDVGPAYFGIDHIKKALNVGYIFPTWVQLRDFSKERIRKIAGETTYLTELLSPVRQGPLRRESDLGLYFIRKGAWYLRGAHNPDQQLASFPVDLLIVDEYDLISARAVTLGEKRLRASPLRWKRYVSKPSLPNQGIDGLYQQSDKHQWQLRCPACGDWQPLDFWANVARVIEPGKVEHYTDWSKRPKEELLRSEYIFVCRHCATPMDRTGPGRWVVQQPDALIHGYHVPGLVAPFVPLIELVKGSLAEEPDILLEWYRADLGLPKSPEGGQLSWDDLAGCKMDYTWPEGAHRCTMGVDVGIKLHVRVGKWVDGGWRAETINNLANAQVLTVDDGLEAYIRELAGFPELPADLTRAQRAEEGEEEEKTEPVAKPDQPDTEEKGISGEEGREKHAEAYASRRRSPKQRRYLDATQAYETSLPQAYQDWAGDTSSLEGLGPETTEEELWAKLDDYLLVGLMLLKEKGYEDLLAAYILGFGSPSIGPEGLRFVEEAQQKNDTYLAGSLFEDIRGKLEGEIAAILLLLKFGDVDEAFHLIENTVLSLDYRPPLYAGTYWEMIHAGIGQRLTERGTTGGPPVRRVLDPLAKHCSTCPPKARVYPSWEAMVAEAGIPGDGSDECDGRCRCSVQELHEGVWIWA